MSIWNKVLVGLIGVVALVLFYMGARALKMQTYWSESALRHEKRIAQLLEQNRTLAAETNAQQVELHKLLVDRRRVWPECDSRIKTGPETAEVTLAISQTDPLGKPVPHGIVNGAVLYAFEKADAKDKGQYLGEFAVSKVIDKDKQIQLVPTSRLSPREVNKLAKAKRSWMLYEVMPVDNHEAFASLSDAEKKAMLPAETVREYLKDGKPAEKDDPRDDVVDGNYVRPLQDYNVLFNDEREHCMLLTDSIEAAQQDKLLVQQALAEARTQADAGAKDIASTTAEKEKLQREVAVVAALLQKIEKNLNAIQAQIVRYSQNNQAMAGQIAKLQLEAARKIDQRTRAMAQSGAGRL